MIHPTIHLNGTSEESLLDGVCEAGKAVRQAIDALYACAPNGRDYYPQGANAFALATEEHRSRIARLTSVLDELQALAEGIAQ